MARIVALPVTGTLLDFPSEAASGADQARPRVTVADRLWPSLVRGAAADSSSAFSREIQAVRSDTSSRTPRSEASRSREASSPDFEYSQFIRILGRGDV
jgi:hypothetical protein